MIPLKEVLTSSVGRKFIMALSGLGLVIFVIIHLAGNLALYDVSGASLNNYAAMLHGFGYLLIAAEVGLLIAFLIHIYFGVTLKGRTLQARENRYDKGIRTKGGPSRNTWASRNMIITGLILAVFLIVHVWQFRFGTVYYTVTQENEQIRDLYRLVVEVFDNIWWVVFYEVVMVVLGFHLAHGIWSAFQSLGVNNPRISRPLWVLGMVLGILLALGFLALPIWIYVQGDLSVYG